MSHEPGGYGRFVTLFDSLDHTTSLNQKLDALESYLRAAPSADVAWAVFFLTGRRLKRLVNSRNLRDWAAAHTGLPAWLIEDCYHTVGDLAETLAILCAARGADEASWVAAGDSPVDGKFSDSARGGPPRTENTTSEPYRPNHSVPNAIISASLAEFVETRLAPLATLSEPEQRAEIVGWWKQLSERECFIAHKLVTGAFRVGVSSSMVAKALARVAGQKVEVIEHRLMGDWGPSPAFGERLVAPEDFSTEKSRPYPFFLATQLDVDPATLGAPDEWLAEWKWDGIRAQLIVRGGAVFLWSRGEELVGERFPEITTAARSLPDGTVLDGEIAIWNNDRVQPFSSLQTRIGRKNLTSRILQDLPAVLLVFDILELDGQDWRDRPLKERRATLERLLVQSPSAIRTSERVTAASWEEMAALRAKSRSKGVEGIMLKSLASPYRAGRPRGDWWKWKVDPYTMDAVLIYGQAGHGRRAALFTDYTFGVWDGDTLVPVAKAYSGLDDEEILRLDAWIRANTIERFGPVRSVEPVHVFELGFEAIQRSPRHKGGIAVRFPRILRWRTDKKSRDANSLEDLRAMIVQAEDVYPERRPRTTTDQVLSLFDEPPDEDR